MQITEAVSAIAKDTITGLSAIPKNLSSKYFYDEAGSKIFQQIMRMQEYYLTDCEHEIFSQQAYSIIRKISPTGAPRELIELGAGDGIKTKLLIKELFRQNIDFRYIPIDISEEILHKMTTCFRTEFGGLEVVPMAGDYFDMMEELEMYSSTPKVILFLGSNIGNFTEVESISFFRRLREIIKDHDKLIIGFDLKKEARVIQAAYNDSHGHTSRFNLNILRRLNNELDADFNLNNFEHAPLYNALTGTAESYIVSKVEQEVTIRSIRKSFRFKKWEAIYTERSQKYDIDMITMLAESSGFEVIKNFTDKKEYFIDSLWKPKQ